MAANSPSINPCDQESGFPGILKFLFDKQMQNMDDCLPARVVSYDRAKNRGQLELLYMVTGTDGGLTQMSGVASVPCLQLGGGGFMLSFNVKAGDLVWIKACDQDITLFKQNYSAFNGNTKRMHSFKDSFFIPDIMRSYSISGEDSDAVVLQSVDGSIKVSLNTSRLKLAFNSTSVTLNDSAINMTVGGASFAMSAGGVESSVPMTLPDVIVDGVSVKSHVHINPEGGNVGPMIAG